MSQIDPTIREIILHSYWSEEKGTKYKITFNNPPKAKTNPLTTCPCTKERVTNLTTRLPSQLSEKQERDKRAELHRLLSSTGRFDSSLQEAANEVAFFNTALETLEKAVARCTEFANSASQRLSETEIPSSSEGAKTRLQEQKSLLKTLEDEQRQLEYAFRGLTRSIPQIIPMSVSVQQKDVAAVQNTLSDIEGHLNNSAESLAFLVSRLPSLEQKLTESDDILTAAEDSLDCEEEPGSPGLEDLQLQIDRAKTYLNNVNNLFVPMECFGSGEYVLEPLREEWSDLTERAHRANNSSPATSYDIYNTQLIHHNRASKKIRELIVEEDALSEEVILILDWADTLKLFLTRRPKPAETREQLVKIVEKWREVEGDLGLKTQEIKVLLESGGREQARVMSPLDKDTLFDLQDQLAQLQVAVRNRTTALEEANTAWGQAESHITSITSTKSIASIELTAALALPSPSGLSAIIKQSEVLQTNENALLRQGARLEQLIDSLSLISPSLVNTSTLQQRREKLCDEHSVFCKRATGLRCQLQQSAARYQSVFPFLRNTHRATLVWLYGTPLLDIETVPDPVCRAMVESCQGNPRPHQYIHSVRTISVTKLSLLVFNWVVFAVGPWGMGSATDRPYRIYDYSFDIRF
eukprot:sb/3479407/